MTGARTLVAVRPRVLPADWGAPSSRPYAHFAAPLERGDMGPLTVLGGLESSMDDQRVVGRRESNHW